MDWRQRIAEFERLHPEDESGRIVAPPPKPAPVVDMTAAFGWLVLAFLFIPVAPPARRRPPPSRPNLDPRRGGPGRSG